MPDSNRSNQGQGSGKNILLKLIDFINDHIKEQPPWLQAVTFIIILGLVVLGSLGIFRTTIGKYSVHGFFYARTNNQSAPATMYNLYYGQKFYGVNNRGEYWLILDSANYFMLMASPTLSLKITDLKGNSITSKSVTYSRFGDFNDIILTADDLNPIGMNNNQPRDVFKNLAGTGFFSTAWADTVDSKYNRFFITQFYTNNILPASADGTFSLAMNNRLGKLLDAGLYGSEVGSINLIPGSFVDLGTKFYFKIPVDASRTGAVIQLSSRTGPFSSYTETFPMNSNTSIALNSPVTLSGSQGSTLIGVYFSPYDAKLFIKADLQANEANIVSDLHKNGFRVVEAVSPLGFSAETNALFGGLNVPLGTMQTMQKIALRNHLPIKTIVYQKDLKSKNPYEIQVGGFVAFDEKKVIPQRIFERLDKAKSDDEYKNMLSKNKISDIP